MSIKQLKIEDSTLSEKLKEIVSSLDKALEPEIGLFKPARLPRELFHYTTAEGLRGILDSKKLFATNLLFMNDRMELGYGLSLARSVIASEMAKREKDSWENAILELTKSSMDFYDWEQNSDQKTRLDYYGICFCEKGDELPLWRAYAKQGIGYAVGIVARKFATEFDDGGAGTLVKVVYDREVQEAALKRLVNRFLSVLGKAWKDVPKEDQEEATVHFLLSFGFVLSYFILGFKHPSFAGEKEWRYIHTCDETDLDLLDFRSRGGSLVPYLKLGMMDDKALPVASIIHGPGAQQQASLVGLQLFLEKKKMAHLIRVKKSEVPLVSWGE
ncbi:MAG: DUF2971 domain-containing protein [Thermoplasmatota archaeon]